MTNTKHTPAPWYVDEMAESKHMADCIMENDTWIAIEDTSDDGGHIAYCHPDNANLIAAAPEMLEALLLTVEPIEEGGSCGLPVAIYNKVCAVIAKAKGEA